VFDESVITQQIASSLNQNGIFIINSEKDPEHIKNQFKLSDTIKIIVADINKLSIEKDFTIDGNPVINTPILGLLSKALPDLSLENLEKIVNKRMSEKIAKLNIELIEEGYKMARMS
jgi:Pyruvate/2-oxoacid:ferredoxin oxidoreductase gamma subunit